MTDHITAIAADLDREPDCRCVETDWGTDTLGCAMHAPTPEGRQWNRDHPNGISAEEDEAMCRYAFESCRDEGHIDTAARTGVCRGGAGS